MSVTLTRFGTLVITRSSMLLPRVVFFLLSCVKRCSRRASIKASSLTPEALSMESPEDVWQIKVTRNYHIVELVTNFIQQIIEYIHPTWVFIRWPIAKTE